MEGLGSGAGNLALRSAARDDTRLERSVRTGGASLADEAQALNQVVERARAGDRAALAQLYDEFSPQVYRYLYRQCGNAELSEDLTADVFLQLIRAIDRDHAWKQSFTGWLFSIARNRLTDHYRKQGRRDEQPLEAALSMASGADPAGEAMDSVSMDAVRSAITGLSQRHADVILMRFAEGLSNREVAERLGIREGTVKVTQHRALKALQRKLRAQMEDGLEGRRA